MFAELIKVERERQGLSLSHLAEKAQVTKPSLHQWEHGKGNISLKNADKVLKALGISMKIGK